jgi:hypothetical protein
MELNEVTDPFHDPNLYKQEFISPIKEFKKLFRRLDIYALPITFRYKGEKKFYTNFGALTSILVILLVLAYTYTEINLMLGYTKFTTTDTKSSTLERDQATGDQQYDYLLETAEYANITFGIKVMHANDTVFWDDRYFTVNISQTNATWNVFENIYEKQSSVLKLKSCADDWFFQTDE